MRKMYNAQKKPLDSLKEQIEQLLRDLGEPASKSPNKNKKLSGGGQESIKGFVIPPKREWEDGDNFDDCV